MNDAARPERKSPAAGAGPVALVCLLAIAPFLPKLANGLLEWDDDRFIRQMTLIHSLANFPQFFRHGADGLYRPARDALYALSYDALGFADRPLGWQIVGLALHAMCAALFFAIARRLLADGVAALAAGALFAVHPIHVERVAGVTASYDLLGDALLLAAVLAYLGPAGRDEDAPAKSWGWLGWLTAGLFASENAAIFPALALAVDAARAPNLRALRRRDRLARYAAAFATIALYLVCRREAIGALGRNVPRPVEGLTNNALGVAAADLKYLEVAVAPWRTNYFHLIDARALAGSWTAWATLLGLAALLALGVARRRTAAGLGAMWFFVCLLPFSQLAPNVNLCQDRYAYLAFGGVALALGAAASAIARRVRRPAGRVGLAAAGLAAVVALGALTWSYTAAFHDDLSLWSRVARVEPRHAGAQNNVGSAWLRRGRPDLALLYFERANALDPAFTLPLRNMARAWQMLGRPDEAAAAAERYLRLVPADAAAAAEYQRLRAGR